MIVSVTNTQAPIGAGRTLVKIRVESGADAAVVRGYLSVGEQQTLAHLCEAAGATLYIEPESHPVGLAAVLEAQDTQRAKHILSILERREG
jgi:hypothetical protein